MDGQGTQEHPEAFTCGLCGLYTVASTVVRVRCTVTPVRRGGLGSRERDPDQTLTAGSPSVNSGDRTGDPGTLTSARYSVAYSQIFGDRWYRFIARFTAGDHAASVAVWRAAERPIRHPGHPARRARLARRAACWDGVLDVGAVGRRSCGTWIRRDPEVRPGASERGIQLLV